MGFLRIIALSAIVILSAATKKHLARNQRHDHKVHRLQPLQFPSEFNVHHVDEKHVSDLSDVSDGIQSHTVSVTVPSIVYHPNQGPDLNPKDYGPAMKFQNTDKVQYDGYYYGPLSGDSSKLWQLISGTETRDTARGGDRGDNWHWVSWTDSWNQEHTLKVRGTAQVTLWFPVSNQEVIWYSPGISTRTGFDRECNWAQVRFTQNEGNIFNTGGVDINFRCFKYKDNPAPYGVFSWSFIKELVGMQKDVTPYLTWMFGPRSQITTN